MVAVRSGPATNKRKSKQLVVVRKSGKRALVAVTPAERRGHDAAGTAPSPINAFKSNKTRRSSRIGVAINLFL